MLEKKEKEKAKKVDEKHDKDHLSSVISLACRNRFQCVVVIHLSRLTAVKRTAEACSLQSSLVALSNSWCLKGKPTCDMKKPHSFSDPGRIVGLLLN